MAPVGAPAPVGPLASPSPPDPGASGTAREGDLPRSGPDLATTVAWFLAVLGFLIGSRPISDNSFLTHLATGRLILERGSVPDTDPYSLFGSGLAWTVQSWLASVVYATLDRLAGGWSIRVLNGLLAVAIVAGLWRLTRATTQLVVRLMLVSVVLLIGTYLWPPRPLLFGLVAMVITLEVVQGLRARWWLVPVFALWVNLHGSFVLGLALLGAVVVGAAIDNRSLPRAELAAVGAALAGCLGALVSPVGWRLLWFPFHMMDRGEALDRVSEWASPSFRSPVEQLFLVPLILMVVAASRRARWRCLVPAVGFFVGGLLAVRNLGLASLVVVALVAPALEGLAGSVDGSSRPLGARLGRLGAGAGLGVLALSVALSPPVELSDYPVAEVDWLAQRDLVADPDVRLAQRDFVGNYLNLRFADRARVFMDDRFDFHPLDVIEDHNALLLGGDVAEVMERRRFDVILWATGTHVERWIHNQDGWWVALEGDDWFVACRKASPVADRCR